MTPEPPPPPASPNARYAYLVARLRNRQITMEEATELFGILQDTLARTIARQPSPGSAPMPPPRPPEGTTPSGPAVPAITDETLALSLIALGAGAGLVSAILKRHAEGPKPPRPA